MKNSNDLYQLCHTLTKGEKRYFKSFTSRHLIRGGSNYQLMFDLLLKQKVYDEKALKSSCKEAGFKGSFTETKYQLYHKILSSLSNQYRDSSVTGKLTDAIAKAEILLNKRLHTQAIKVIYKAKKIAYEYEKFDLVLQLLFHERQARVIYSSYEELGPYMESFHQEREEAQAKQKNINDYASIGDKLYYFHLKHGVVRTDEQRAELELIFDTPLLQNPELAICAKARLWYAYCYRSKGFIIQDDPLLYEYAIKYVDVLESTPSLIREVPTRYVSSLENICMGARSACEFPKLLETLVKMRAIPNQYKEANSLMTKTWIYFSANRMELDYYDETGQFEHGVQRIKELEKEMDTYEDLIRDNNFLLYNYEKSKIFFGAGLYDESLDCIDNILNFKDGEMREDVASIMRLLQLIIHYEKEDRVYLPYVIRSTYRYLLKKERLYLVEKELIKFIRKLSNVASENELREEFIALRDKFIIIKPDAQEGLALEYFDIISWLSAKIDKRPYAEVVQEKYEGVELGRLQSSVVME